MLKKTITYEDFNGETVVEDHFFHLSKAELVELELSHQGGLAASLQKIISSEDGKAIIAEFKNIILTSYGKRSDDGRRFIKNQEFREEFESTEAYSALFMELVTDTDAAVEFVNGIIPAGMSEEAAKLAGIDPKTTPLIVVENESPGRLVTRKEFVEMSQDELRELGPKLASGEVKLEQE
jgi:hypothetical protein